MSSSERLSRRDTAIAGHIDGEDPTSSVETSKLRNDIAALREALDAALAAKRRSERELAHARRELARAVARYDVSHEQLVAVYGSLSWRLTSPLRSIRGAAKDGRLRPRRVIRGVVVRSMRFVLRLAFVRRATSGLLGRFPRLRERLRPIAVRMGLVNPLTPAEAERPHGPPAYLSHGALSPKAARVLDELILAMSNSGK